MSAHWKSYPDAEAAAEACATHVVSVIEMGLAGDGDVNVAFSGGSTPKLMFSHLCGAKLDWTRVQVYFVDERCVPAHHEDSNYRMVEEHLLRPARVPQRNVHRIHGELAPAQAARHYEAEIRDCFDLQPGELPHFDLLHLGVGADGHTASLFPRDPLLEDREHIAAAVHPAHTSHARVTLLPGVLLAARHAAVLVSGADKAEALRRILRDRYAPSDLPAQIIAHHSRKATWFLDGAAAALLE